MVELAALLRSLIVRVYRALSAAGFPRGARPEGAESGFGDYERIEGAKFHTPGASPAAPPEAGELPELYGETLFDLLPVDPYTVHAYWRVAPARLEEASRRLGADGNPPSAVLRIYDVTFFEDPLTTRDWFDVDIDLEAKNWYVTLPGPARRCCADLGLRTATGQFLALARSQVIETPRASPSVALEERYMRVEAMHPAIATAPEAAARAAPAPAPAPAEIPGPPPVVAQTEAYGRTEAAAALSSPAQQQPALLATAPPAHQRIVQTEAAPKATAELKRTEAPVLPVVVQATTDKAAGVPATPLEQQPVAPAEVSSCPAQEIFVAQPAACDKPCQAPMSAAEADLAGLCERKYRHAVEQGSAGSQHPGEQSNPPAGEERR